MKHICLGALVLFVISCGGDTNTDSKSVSSLPGGKPIGSANHAISGAMKGKYTNNEYESSTGSGILSEYSSTVKGNKITYEVSEDFDDYVTINGKNVSYGDPGVDYYSLDVGGWDTDFGNYLGIIHMSFLDPKGNPISVYDVIDTALDKNDIVLSKRPDASWTYGDVEYSTTRVFRSGYTDYELEDDGTITFNGDTWRAQLGSVTLNGKLNGQYVTGKATLNDGVTTPMKGDFSGFDGNVESDSGDVITDGTIGGYAGENAAGSFSGGWLY